MPPNPSLKSAVANKHTTYKPEILTTIRTHPTNTTHQNLTTSRDWLAGHQPIKHSEIRAGGCSKDGPRTKSYTWLSWRGAWRGADAITVRLNGNAKSMTQRCPFFASV